MRKQFAIAASLAAISAAIVSLDNATNHASKSFENLSSIVPYQPRKNTQISNVPKKQKKKSFSSAKNFKSKLNVKPNSVRKDFNSRRR